MKTTADSMQRARQWFADNALECAAAADAGEFHVNDLAAYKAERAQFASDALAGKLDHTFTFMQRAHFIQTGECVALLPKGL